MVNLDCIGREEFARLFREACQAGGISSSEEGWLEISEARRTVHRTAADHLRASLKARLTEASEPTPARRLNDLVVRD